MDLAQTIDSEFIKKEWDRLFAVAFKLVADEESARDVVQDSFIKGLNSKKIPATYDHLANWMKRIVINRSIDHLRRNQGRRMVDLDNQDDYSRLWGYIAVEGEAVIENRDLARFIEMVVGRLPYKQRVVFTLIELKGLSAKEVVETTGYSSSRVKSNLSIAKKKVREILENNM